MANNLFCHLARDTSSVHSTGGSAAVIVTKEFCIVTIISFTWTRGEGCDKLFSSDTRISCCTRTTYSEQ
jgi:hypothetical protein